MMQTASKMAWCLVTPWRNRSSRILYRLMRPLKFSWRARACFLSCLTAAVLRGFSDTANLLSNVPTVRNHLLTGGDVALEAVLFAHNLKVRLPSWEGTVDPNQLIVIDRNTKFIGKIRVVELVRAPSGARLLPNLVNDNKNKNFDGELHQPR
jgi:hypothetical protein